jgi:hypothetical protein
VQISEWANHTRRAWEQRFDRLDDYLRELQTPPTKETKHVRKRR